MCQSRPNYQYRSLREQLNEIRLVKVCSDTDESAVHCQLEQFTGRFRPPYTALSYAWGSPEKDAQIVLNECSFSITTSLEQFLLQARKATIENGWKSQWLWIDAICINQDDVSERNCQIEKMKTIFEDARYVIIWLGPSSTELKNAMDMIKHFNTVLIERKGAEIVFNTDFLGPEDKPFAAKDWKALANFLNLPWFYRAWCLQEGSSPKSRRNIKIWCGSQSSVLAALFRTRQVLWFLKQRAATQSSQVESLISRKLGTRSLYRLQLAWEHRRRKVLIVERGMKFTNTFTLDLLHLLQSTRDFQASDPRDKIYSILSLAWDATESGIRADYSESVREIYTETCQKLIQYHRNLNVFSLCHFDNDQEIPSWVPDWRARFSGVPFPIFRLGMDDMYIKVYNASAGNEAEVHFELVRGVARVRGISVDTIMDISAPRLRREVSDNVTLAAAWFELATCYRSQIVYSGAAIDALEHTLCADINHRSAYRISRGCSKSVTQRSRFDRFPQDWFVSSRIVDQLTEDRKLISTSKGFIGLAPRQVRIGDVLAILFGGQMPVVLRKEQDHFLLIGVCYVHGIMDGEAFANMKVEEEAQVFEIW